MGARTTIPAPSELIGRARDLAPILAARAGWGNEHCRLPDETVADMQGAGFFRVLQPRRWGGFEMSPGIFSDIQAALGAGDLSPAWVYGVVGVHPWLVALLDDRAARDVWSENDAALISSPISPSGKAVPVAGGYRFSGRWSYASGCQHCDWAFLGGMAEESDWRLFLVPKSDFRIVEQWDVAGLRGTGSHDIVVEDAFVPSHRVHRMEDNFACRGPGQELNGAPLYRIPFGQIFFRGVSTGAVGALQGMVDAFRAWGGARETRQRGRLADDPDAQIACAEAASAVDEIMTVLHRNFAALEAYAEARQVPPLDERLKFRFQSADAVERCALLAARLFKAAGGAALRSDLPFARMLGDIAAARQHVANRSSMIGRNYGSVLLGGTGRRDLML
jgi:3-hydroxy-9,10-secoandrosta-1,3,5(10)-triene-9,17-dione monooxygenase